MNVVVRRPPEELDAVLRPDGEPAVAWRIARLAVEAAVRSVSAVDGALTREPAGRFVVDVLMGGGAIAGDVAGRLVLVGRTVGAGMLRLPLVGKAFGPVRALAERGRRERVAAEDDLQRLAAVLVPAVAAAVLDRLDLTALVRERVALDAIVAEVDIDAIVAMVDVDAIARRVDLDAIVDRLDLVALTNRAIEGVDLAEIIRESTGSVAGDMVRGVRMQGVAADRAVVSLMDRLLRRAPPPATDELGTSP
jgi:hypothetical protein